MSFPVVTKSPWAIVVVLLAFTLAAQRLRKPARLPPGPTPLPIVGNVLDFPREHLGRGFAALSKKFGDVLYLRALGQDTIVLGSLKAAQDLLEKRSANYSDRPTSVMVQLVGYDWMTAFMNYGARWRQHRRAMHSVMKPDVLSQYKDAQSGMARNFVRLLLEKPEDLASHITFTIAAVMMEAVYGIAVREPHDKYFKMVDRMAEVVLLISVPGKYLVESIPALRYLPSRFPGGSFKRWAAEAKRDIACIVDYLFASTKTTGERDPSKMPMISHMLGNSALQDEHGAGLDDMCKQIAATLYAAGAETSSVVVGAFFQAMALYPSVQKKAHAELDAVVGTNRLPEVSDSASLPYIAALAKEVLRWHPVSPVGFPHRVVADDEYNGYFIPSGATVLVNMWDILRDPAVYPQPEDFVPERFLDSTGNLDTRGRDPADVVFGFGRRACPGRYFAESTLFILFASVLWAFEIGPPVGEDGTPMDFKREATDHLLLSHPKVYKYSIKPRSGDVERLVGTTLAH